MITLPTAISNNKNKQNFKPVIMIDFVDLNYRVSNSALNLYHEGTDITVVAGPSNQVDIASAFFQTWDVAVSDTITIDGIDYTINSIDSETQVTISSVITTASNYSFLANVYNDNMRKGSNVYSSTSVPELLNQVVGTSNLTLRLLGWRSELRSSIVGTSPDLTDSQVDIYFALDTGSNVTIDDRVKIFTGFISNYGVENDTMTLYVKSSPPYINDIPTDVLPNESDICYPIHFGDFKPTGLPTYWSQSGGNRFAACPLIGYGEDGIATYAIAQHALDTAPGTGDFDDRDATKGFVVRDNLWVAIEGVLNGATVTNGTPSTIELDLTSQVVDGFLFLPPTREGDFNDCTNFANAVDGNNSTYATVDDSGTLLQTDTFNASNLRENTLSAVGTNVKILVSFGTISGSSSFEITITDGTNTSTEFIGSIHQNAVQTYSFPSALASISEIDNYEVRIEQLTGGESCQVRNIVAELPVQPVTENDRYIYLALGGLEFGGTWNSRKTAASLMDYPNDFIEWLLRNEWGFGNSNIDMDSFDDMSTFWQTTVGVISNGSIVRQQDGYRVLNSICKGFNMCLMYSLPDAKWRLKFPSHSENDFSSSGTGTAGAEDIFTDSDTLSSGEFTNHPILKGSFSLRRTSESQRYKKLVLNYRKTINSYLKSISTGSGKTITIDNEFIGRDDSATNLLARLDNWLLDQKWIATFKTSISAIAHEIGDVINIRHNDLNDDILYATVNGQKWMIIDHKINWRPFYIQISAIELID